MIIKEELEEWRQDIKIAGNTPSSHFANGPFLRSLFKVSQNIDVVGQHIGHLSSATREVKNSLSRASEDIRNSNSQIERLQKAGAWLTAVIVLTGIFELVKYFSGNEIIIVIAGITLAVLLGFIVGYFLKK